MASMQHTYTVDDADYGVVTVTLRPSVSATRTGRFPTPKDGRTRQMRAATFALRKVARVARKKRDRRAAVMSAARMRESARRATRDAALVALDTFLAGKVETVVLPTDLQGRYDLYRQARRETAWLMSRVPHDGRPPMAVAVASTVNAQETRASERWSVSAHERDGVRSIRVSSRRIRERGTDAAIAAAIGGGRDWFEYVAPATERAASRKSRKPSVKESRAARLRQIASQSRYVVDYTQAV